MTRGERNCNPGNIRHGALWQGMAPEQPDPEFVTFIAPEWGIRAIGRILLHYETLGLKTVRGLITRYAPSTENNTPAYVSDVAQHLGVGPDDPIHVWSSLWALLPAIIAHENGEQPYSDELIGKAISLI